MRRFLRNWIVRWPSIRDLPYKEVSFFSRGDGVSLSGWWIPVFGSERCIVIWHGGWRHRDDLKIGTAHLALVLAVAGYNVLLPDFRGHGRSGGEWRTIGADESRDVLGAFDWVKNQGISSENIAILGFSMGAAATLLAASQEKEIVAVVSDSSWADFSKVSMPRKDALALFLLFEEVEAVSPIEVIEAIPATTRVLLIHGGGDNTIPPTHAEELWEALKKRNPDNPRPWVPDGGHTQAFALHSEEYVSRVIAFLEE